MTINLSGIAELDPNGHLSSTSSTCTASGMRMNEVCYQYIDYGSGYFQHNDYITGHFKHTANTSGGAEGNFALSNQLADVTYAADAMFFEVSCDSSGNGTLYLDVYEGGTVNNYAAGAHNYTRNTDYYYKFGLDSTLGTHGGAFIKTYSDSGLTTLIETVTVNFANSGVTYRYLMPTVSTSVVGTTETISYQNGDITLVVHQALTASLYSNSSSFFSHTVSHVGPSSQPLTAPLISNQNILYALRIDAIAPYVTYGIVPTTKMLRSFRAMSFRNREMMALFGARRIVHNKILVDAPSLINENPYT